MINKDGLMKVSMLLRNVCVVGAVVLVAGCANEPAKPQLTPAQQAIAAMSYDQKATKFLEIIHADKLATPAYIQVQEMFEQLAGASKLSDSTRLAALERYQAQANAVLDKAVGWDVIKQDVIRLYTTNFTDAELGQMIDFYESPTGQKMLRQLPEVTSQVQLLIRQRVLENAAPQINSIIQAMAKDLKVPLQKTR